MQQSDTRNLKDRRRQPTPVLSWFVFSGRRRSFRRKEDQKRGGYVDQYDSILAFLVVLIAVLSVADSFLTMMILNNGGWEVNPIVRGAIELWGHNFWVWKFTTASVFLILLCLPGKFRRVSTALVGLATVHVAVVAYEVYLLSQGQ
jgi:hypothetical protein